MGHSQQDHQTGGAAGDQQCPHPQVPRQGHPMAPGREHQLDERR